MERLANQDSPRKVPEVCPTEARIQIALPDLRRPPLASENVLGHLRSAEGSSTGVRLIGDLQNAVAVPGLVKAGTAHNFRAKN